MDFDPLEGAVETGGGGGGGGADTPVPEGFDPLEGAAVSNPNTGIASPAATPPTRTPGTQQLGWSTVGPAFWGGMKRGVGQVGETITGKPGGEDYVPGQEGMEWSDILHPGALATKFAERFGEGSPTTAGGFAGMAAGSPLGVPGQVIGGGLGAAGMAALQSMGPALKHELAATPDDPDGAYNRALQSSLQGGAFSGAAWSLFPMKFFTGPLKNLAFQAFGIQPGLAVGHQALENVEHGRPTLEGAGEAAGEAAAGTAVSGALGRFLGKGDVTARNLASRTNPDRPASAADLKDVSRDHFNDIKDMGVKYSQPSELKNLQDEIKNDLYDFGADPRDQPGVFSAIDDLSQSRRPSGTVDFADIAHARERLAGYLGSTDGRTAASAARALFGPNGKGGLDGWLGDPGKQTAAGVDPLQARVLADKYKLARSYWHAGKAMEAWDLVQDKIDHSNTPDTTRRTIIRQIVDNPKVHWQYPKEAISLMRDSLDANRFTRAVDKITKWFSPHSATGLMTDFLLHNFTGHMSLAAPLMSEVVGHQAQQPMRKLFEPRDASMRQARGVPHIIRQVPTLKAGQKPQPGLGDMGILGRSAAGYTPMGPAYVPQPQYQDGGEVPIGDFDEALDPRAELLPNYPSSPPDPELFAPGQASARPLAPQREPTIGDFTEALNPFGPLTGGAYGSPDPLLMDPHPTPRPDIVNPPMPRERPPVPFAAPGQGKGAPVPFAAPGVGGKGAAPAAMRIARRGRRHHYQEGGEDQDTPPPDDSSSVQDAAEAAAARTRRAVGPSPMNPTPQEIPERLQSFSNYGQSAANQAVDWATDMVKHPENIVGTDGLNTGMFLPAGKALTQTAEAGLRKGMSVQDLWDLAGTFKDAGGDWRTEAMGPTALKIDPYTPFKGQMGQAYDNPALYSRMPEIARMPFELKKPSALGDPRDPTLGQYYPHVGSSPAQIEARTLVQGEEYPEQLLDTLAHEMQHGVDQRAGLLRNVAGDYFWHTKGLKGDTNNPQWQQYVDELTPFFKGDREKASVSAEMGTVPDAWHKAAKQAVDFDRYKRSIHEVMARLTGRRESIYNIIHGMEGPKGAARDLKRQTPFNPQGTTGYDVPAELQLLGKKYSKAPAPQSRGGAAQKALKLARRAA